MMLGDKGSVIVIEVAAFKVAPDRAVYLLPADHRSHTEADANEIQMQGRKSRSI